MLENQTFLAPLLPFWEKRCTERVEVGLGDEGIHWESAFALGIDRARLTIDREKVRHEHRMVNGV